ncbi:tetratricopeptide repeat protein [Rickettsia asembonensis]|uniref:tetratricopeptide repeat protein n=1 Tax=Rickettsia asembonensis TaxID=1068590 RepID=UPI0023F87F8F|nr:tetratricopeptide repeat protein [Rickettsia asembonensis]WCR56655.1 MAG: hypothetical protein PG979_000712 [Rickettsia asembonensis]
MWKYSKFILFILLFISSIITEAKTVSYTEYYNKGVEFYQIGQYELALETFSKGIKINPNDTNLYNSKGVVLSDLGKYDLVLEASNKAIEMNSNNSNLYSDRASVLAGLGKYNLALEDINRAIKLNSSNNLDFYYNKSLILLKLGKR